MGQGNPGDQHQGGVIGATSAKCSVTLVPRMATMTAIGTELPIPNVRSSVANGGKADKKCSMRVLRILTDSVDKVPDERVEALY
jgi:hypothetical protein